MKISTDTSFTKNLSILSSGLLLSLGVFAQKPSGGFVITKNGDTTIGSVVIPKGVKGLHYIVFKASNLPAAQTYYANDLAGFTTKDGDIYVSSNFTYDIGPFVTRTNNESNQESYGHAVNPDNLKQMQYKDTGIYITRSLFARVLVFGEASLYYFKDSTERTHFFMSKNNGPPEELTFRRFFKKNVAGPMQSSVTNQVTSHHTDADESLNSTAFTLLEVEDNAYRGQLLKALGDCAGVQLSDFAKLQYYEEDLVPLFRKYDLCRGKLLYIEKY